MDILKTTVRAVKGRPFIIILPAVLILLCSVLNTYNPVLPIITGIASITGGSAIDSLVSVIQLLLDPSLMPVIVVMFVGLALLTSLFVALILSGYFNVLAKALDGLPGERGEFWQGLRRYFLRYFTISLRAVPFLLLLAAFMLVCSIPAVIVTRAVTPDKPELLIAAVFVDVLTVAVLFFAFIFSRAYIFFWYPSAMEMAKKPFSYGKRLVDGHFWGIVLRILIFDVVFVGIHYIISIIGSHPLQLVLGWLFDTAFLATLAVYVFRAFKEFRSSPGAEE
jgi:hypothetical protein